MSGGPSCPQCGAEVLPTWDWCEGCGWDPSGLKPAGWTPPPPMMRAAAGSRGAPAPPPPGMAGTMAPPPPGARGGAVPPPPGAPGMGASTGPGSSWQVDSAAAWTLTPVQQQPPGVAQKAKRGRVGRRLGMMAVLLVVGIAVLVGVVAVFGHPDPGQPVTKGAWVTAAAPDGSFHVDLPGGATIGTDSSSGSPNNYVAWPSKQHAQYAVSYANMTPLAAGQTLDVSGTLSNAINGVSQTGAKITNTLDVPFQNNQARAFSGTADGGLPVKGLVFIRGMTIYVLVAEGPNAVGQADRFFDSFVLAS